MTRSRRGRVTTALPSTQDYDSLHRLGLSTPSSNHLVVSSLYFFRRSLHLYVSVSFLHAKLVPIALCLRPAKVRSVDPAVRLSSTVFVDV